MEFETNNYIDSIFEGKYFERNSKSPLQFNQIVLEFLNKSVKCKGEFLNEFYKIESFYERINYISKFIPSYDFAPFSSNGLKKNSEFAQKFLEKAVIILNQNEKKDNHLKDVIRLINLAICFTEEGGDKNLNAKIDSLRKSTIQKLNPHKDIENGKIENFNLEREKRKNFCSNILFKIQKPNPTLLSADECVEIKFSKEKGRGLFVNRDVSPGEILLVEKPYAKVLLKELFWDLEHCCFCFKKLLSGLACDNCVFEFYCSQNCKESAYKKYHKYECNCLAFFFHIKVSYLELMTFRIICRHGPENITKIIESSSKDINLELINLEMFAFSNGSDPKTEIYDSDSYLPIYHLMSHHEQDSMELQGFLKAFKSFLFTTALEYFSPEFFQQQQRNSIEEKKLLKIFTASLILKNLNNVPSNSYTLLESQGLEGLECEKDLNLVRERISRAEKNKGFAVGIYPLIGLINHSCDPLTTRVTCPFDGKMSIVALKQMKKGDEIITSYGQYYTIHEFLERRSVLATKQYFICNCIACANKWPLKTELAKQKIRYSCPNCSKLFSQPNKYGEEFEKCILNEDGICQRCNLKFTSMKDEFNSKIKELSDANELIHINKPFEALDKVKICLEFFQNCIPPPNAPLLICEEYLKHLLNLIVVFSEKNL